VVPKLVKDRFDRDMEFITSPEKEVIMVGKKRAEQRVLVVRCALDEMENIRVCFF